MVSRDDVSVLPRDSACGIGAFRAGLFRTEISMLSLFSVLTLTCFELRQCSKGKDPRRGRTSNEEAAVETG